MEEFDDNIDTLVEQFKQMISAGKSRYFDSDEMETIIEEFIEQSDLENCDRALDYALKLFPSHPEFRVLKARKLRLQFDFDAAQKELTEIERLYPPSVEFYKEKFSLLSLVTDPEEDALQILLKAYRLDPSDPEIQYFFAFEFLKKKEIDKAVQCYAIAIKQDAAFVDQMVNFAYYFDENMQYADAHTFYTILSKQFPLLPGVWFGIGLACSWMKKYTEAIDAYHYVLCLDENVSTAHFNIGNAYFEMKEYGKALEQYQMTIELANEDFYAYAAAGDCYFYLSDFENAFFYYQQALSHNPNHEEAILGVVNLLETVGKKKEALAFVEKAFSKNPQSCELLFALAQSFDEDQKENKIVEYAELTLSKIREEDKPEYLCVFLCQACVDKHYEAGICIAEKYWASGNMDGFSLFSMAALYYLNGNIVKGNQHLADALILNYDYYHFFLSLDDRLSQIPDVMKLIENYRPIKDGEK
ncbi:MAG: tetratricopeptide repeat protein [Bacteroidales bacterium]|jgi:tetratricopeptide (TPR) repeat protein|nr:tetratricopeptide repeat protein [Bacteroidales bacterium]